MKSLRLPLNSALLCATVFFSQYAAAGSTVETSSDIGLVAVPAAAWALSQFKDDSEGQYQLYWGLGTTLLSTELLKYTIHERRPDGSDDDSFPSGHTSLTFAAATYVQQRYGWKTSIPFYAAASYVGWSRVHTDRHYTKDVLAGALIGYLNARYFTEPFHGVQVAAYSNEDAVGINLHMAF
ncbi:phosphatase PAP2 family protein [Shewanella avicenniae]|uniref:undecaprenyl-diphosphate phosphatase n=1 Tax=Shewanella avicenniae TaxID=2814294 RepID=A0ABX7QLM4_9GAMM|nr:phosphatase PAP2 family protein [Shewanella avicenniae]QSX32358.1 phosphatase PAP2 family protein [Shewanella avicenniae]